MPHVKKTKEVATTGTVDLKAVIKKIALKPKPSPSKPKNKK